MDETLDGGTIETVSISPPKTGSINNWLDKALDTVSSAAALVSASKGSTDSNAASKINDFLKKSTDGVVVETGLDKNTKIFIGAIVALGLGVWYYKS